MQATRRGLHHLDSRMFVAAAKFGPTGCCCSVSSAELGTASIVGHTKNFGLCLFTGEDSDGEATASAHHCVAQGH